MKIHDLGLWFRVWDPALNSLSQAELFDYGPLDAGDSWSSTIPQTPGFTIYYDGVRVGSQYSDFSLRIVRRGVPNLLKLKGMIPPKNGGIILDFDRLLTLQDFEIIPNPAYKE